MSISAVADLILSLTRPDAVLTVAMTMTHQNVDSVQTPELPFRLLGLTGGISSGKSTVSHNLKLAGFTIIDADVIAREVVTPGSPGLKAICEAFGEAILQPDGHLDRKRLGQHIFADDVARDRLSAILHPLIGQRTASLTSAARERGLPLVVYDAPLIVENNLQSGLDLLIVVAVTPETQLQRLIARDHCTPQEALNRINAQLPLADKVAVADVIVDNNGTKSHTRNQVSALILNLADRLWPDHIDLATPWLQTCAQKITP